MDTKVQLFDLPFLRDKRWDGVLRYKGEEVTIHFALDMQKDDRLILDVEPLSMEAHSLQVIENLYRGEPGQRRLPYAEIEAQTSGSFMLTSDQVLAAGYGFKSSTSEATILPKIELYKAEIRAVDSAPGESVKPSLVYVIRGLSGLASSGEHQVGKVSVYGELKPSKGRDKVVGKVIIQGPRMDFDEIYRWLEECDKTIERVLAVFSLAMGRLLSWELRTFYPAREAAEWVRVPSPCCSASRPAVFYPVNLEPVIGLALNSYAESVDEATGLGQAIRWYLGPAHFGESQFLGTMTALEHLVEAYDRQLGSSRVVERGVFKNSVRHQLFETLDGLGDSKVLSASEVDHFKQAIGGMNRKPFMVTMKDMLDHYGVYYDDLKDDLRGVRNLRNAVVHRGDFGEDEADSVRLVAEELLIRTFLSILKHQGRYISPLRGLKYVPMEKLS